MNCPECGEPCERDEVDNGVGMQAVGPWGCPSCHWVEEILPAGYVWCDYQSIMRAEPVSLDALALMKERFEGKTTDELP